MDRLLTTRTQVILSEDKFAAWKEAQLRLTMTPEELNILLQVGTIEVTLANNVRMQITLEGVN